MTSTYDSQSFAPDEVRQRQPVTESDSSATVSQSNDEKPDGDSLHLERRIGLWSAVSLLIGNMTGSGIFVSVGTLLDKTHSPGLCLVLWCICSFYSFLGALSYCELGTVIPKSGGEYSYFLESFGPLHRFFGPLVAFLYIWINIFIINPCSLAANSLSFATYVWVPILTLAGVDRENTYLFGVLTRIFAVAFITLIAFINCYSITLATRVQFIFTAAKLAGITIIIGGGLYYIAIGSTQYLAIGFDGPTPSVSDIATAFYAGLWAYDGWNHLNYINEELVNPHRNIPRAICISLPLVTFCYVMMNIAYLTVLSPQEIIESDAVAADWANIVLGPASFLIPLAVIISIFGNTLGTLFGEARISHVAGREGHLLDLHSYVHIEKRTPVAPILINSFIGIMYTLPGNITSLINNFGFTSSIFSCLTMISLLVMRYTKKDVERPFKVPIVVPIIVMLTSAILVIGTIASDPQLQQLYVLIFIFAGVIFYIPFVYYKKVLPGMGNITIFIQKLLLIAPTTSR